MILSKEKFAEAVDLEHRFEPVSFFDNINPALERAKAIADLIEVAINVDEGEALGPETIRYAAQAIRMEVKDAQAMLNAWWSRPELDFQENDFQGDDSMGGAQ